MIRYIYADEYNHIYDFITTKLNNIMLILYIQYSKLTIMKKLLLSHLKIFAVHLLLVKQNGCCKNQYAKICMLASEQKIVMSHANPRPYHFQSTIGKASP